MYRSLSHASLFQALVEAYTEMKVMFWECYQSDHERLAQSLQQDLRTCISHLKRAGLDINTRDRQGKTALHTAALKGDPATLEELLFAGADSNLQDNEGNTPLHYAVERPAEHNGYRSILSGRVAILLQAGANLSLLNTKKQTALDKLSDLGKYEKHPYFYPYSTVVELLLNKGCIFARFPELPDTTTWSLEEFLQIASTSYGIFLPKEEELRASRARVGAVLLHLNRYFTEVTEPLDRDATNYYRQLTGPYLQVKIFLNDRHVSSDDERAGKCSFRKDLLNVYLDHLRWGNPAENIFFETAKKDLIEYLFNKILLLCNERLTTQDPSRIMGAVAVDEFKNKLREAIKKGLVDRITALKNFAGSVSAQSLPAVRAMIEGVYPSSTPKWRERFFRVHHLNPAQIRSL